ncbi:MAG: alpha/beta hydrolase-fold protein [Bacillota bacterium]|nr:alpha/beta hydrolase-fold protein [Bacillota bacterium]
MLKKASIYGLLLNLVIISFLSFTSSVTSAAPPTGYDQYRSNIAHGAVKTITYYSTTTKSDRKAMIYTPPGYTTNQKYSVMYLLHGVGGDETEWYKNGSPTNILDNLYAENKITPMIVVFPNCKAGADTSGFETFQYDLIKDLIPYIDSHYPTLTSSANRAIAGLSAGGGQAMNFGIKYIDYFANIGGFSPGMNTYSPPSTLAPNPSLIIQKTKVVWVSAGDQDAALSIAQGIHDYFVKNNVPHTWYHAPGSHDWPIWKDSLYQFAQLIFKGSPATPTITTKPTPTLTPTSTPTLIATSTPTPTPIKTISIDLNHDGVINIADVILLASRFNSVRGDARYLEEFDLNKDGSINMSDFMMISVKFNTVL